MKLAGLSFDALPPIGIPFRFFVTAPIFVMAVALIILSSGETVWASRWHPSMLAISHGFALGFVSSVMLAALLQLLPVVGGIGFPRVAFFGNSSFLLHVSGTVCLMLGFIWPNFVVQLGAIALLLTGFGLYLGAAGWVLLKKLSQGSTVSGIRLAVIALLVVVLLGLLLQSRTAGLEIMPGSKAITDIHAAWGLFGWFGLMIMAVSFQIVPMFHVAPEFPMWLRRFLPLAISALLLLQFLFIGNVSFIYLSGLLLLLGNSVFVIYLLIVLGRRKRKLSDTTVNYWRLAALSMLGVTLIYCLPVRNWPEALQAKQTMLLAAVFIYLYVVSIVQGMMLKILPFLSYTHLQQKCLSNFAAIKLLPNMHELVKKNHGRVLFFLHLASGLGLIATIIMPRYYWLFGLLLLAEFSFLLILILRTIRLYRRCSAQMDLL
jgi:hypothetical protein